MPLPFKIVISDKYLSELLSKEQMDPIGNEHVLSMLNDFEDEKWRYSNFHTYVWDRVAYTALSAREREALIDDSYTRLVRAAQNLRLIDSSNNKLQTEGSELAEILLYGIMKDYYDALSVVPKIFYKQSSKDNAKGADSVHIVLEKNDFSLWMGEAKFYNSLDDVRLDVVIDSVENTLATDKLKKENSILLNVKDLDIEVTDKELLEKINSTLDNRNSIDIIKPKLHIPVLLLYECEITEQTKAFSDEYVGQIIAFQLDRAQKYFSKQINKLSSTVSKYPDITFHLILFPVPDKDKIVAKFLSTAKNLKEGGNNE